MTVVSVYCVFGTTEEAERVARVVVEERLAACANILGACRSIYRWDGRVQSAEEVPAIFKASANGADRLMARLAELHSYAVPAIVVWPVERSLPSYAKWVVQSSG